jgi:PKD repeat protein
VFARWRSSYGSRLAQAIIYQNADLASPGATNDFYYYFGAYRKDGVEKGAFATEVRAQLAGSGTSTNQPPVANASATPTSGATPLTVAFSSSGSSDADGSIASYAWDLDGDGQFDDSTAANPSYRYESAGVYVTKLRVTDNQGATDVSDPVTITASTSPPSGSVEKAQGKPSAASSSESSSFGPQYANDGNLSTRWSSLFSDGQWWRVDLGGSRTLDAVEVTFNRWAWPKTYTVETSADASTWTLVASETLSAPGTKTSTFPVRSARYVRITGVTRGTSAGTSIEEAKVYGPSENKAPVAKASATPTSGTVPLAVSFSSAGSSDADGSIAAYAWDLDGDGQYDDSSAQNPSSTYSNAGTYTARLRVTDNQGAQAVSNTVEIVAAPAPSQPPTIDLVDVYLLEMGKYEARVIQVVRNTLDLTQNEAKDLVQQPSPALLKKAMPRDRAVLLKEALRELGAVIEFR